jgi:hypothetical protein
LKFDSKKGTAEATLPVPEPSDIEHSSHINFDDQRVECKKLKAGLEDIQ